MEEDENCERHGTARSPTEPHFGVPCRHDTTRLTCLASETPLWSPHFDLIHSYDIFSKFTSIGVRSIPTIRLSI